MTESYPVFANGRMYAAGEPVISAEDQGFLLGLSVFDTLLYEEGCIYFLEEHLERLASGAGELAIAWPPPWDPTAALAETARALGGRDAALRITLTRGVPGKGATMTVTPRALELPADPGVRVWVSSYLKLGGERLESVKSTNRLRNVLAREEAQANDAWEALLANHDGDVSEGTVSNLFVVLDGALCTPSIDRGCLGGIVRAQILADLEREPLRAEGRVMPVRTCRVDIADLARAEEAFLSNTTGRVTPIVEIAGDVPGLAAPRRLPGAAGTITRAIRTRVQALEAGYRRSERNLAGRVR